MGNDVFVASLATWPVLRRVDPRKESITLLHSMCVMRRHVAASREVRESSWGRKGEVYSKQTKHVTLCIIMHAWLFRWHFANLLQRPLCRPDWKIQLHWQPHKHPLLNAAHFNATLAFYSPAKVTCCMNSGYRANKSTFFHTTDKSLQWKQPREWEHRSLTVCVVYVNTKKYSPHDLKPTGRF